MNLEIKDIEFTDAADSVCEQPEIQLSHGFGKFKKRGIITPRIITNFSNMDLKEVHETPAQICRRCKINTERYDFLELKCNELSKILEDSQKENSELLKFHHESVNSLKLQYTVIIDKMQETINNLNEKLDIKKNLEEKQEKLTQLLAVDQSQERKLATPRKVETKSKK